MFEENMDFTGVQYNKSVKIWVESGYNSEISFYFNSHLSMLGETREFNNRMVEPQQHELRR